MFHRLRSLLAVAGLLFPLLTVPALTGAAVPPVPPSALTGEAETSGNSFPSTSVLIDGIRSRPFPFECSSSMGSGTATYTMSGTAIGPYTGPFTEQITLTITDRAVTRFDTTFTIDTRYGKINGTASLGSPGAGDCSFSGRGLYIVARGDARYTATIPTLYGDYRDEGTMAFDTRVVTLAGPDSLVRLTQGEAFLSRLGQAIPVAPTSKERCKGGGDNRFIDPRTGQPLTDQGRCIQFVNTGR